MKTKIWIIASMILMLPYLFSSIISMMAALTYNNLPPEEIVKLNHPFIIWGSLIGVLSMAVILTTFLQVLPKASEIDSLWEAKKFYYEEGEKLSETRAKLIKKLEEN